MKFDFDNYDIHDLIDDWFESGFDIDANERMIKVHSLFFYYFINFIYTGIYALDKVVSFSSFI